jgi:hypothetical protein
MQKIKTIQFGLKLLSAFLLISAYLFDISPTSELDGQARIYVEVESNAQTVNTEYLLQENKSHNNKSSPGILNDWLQLATAPIAEVFSKLLYDPWPEKSRINSYRSIISYQYCISSLNSFFNQ